MRIREVHPLLKESARPKSTLKLIRFAHPPLPYKQPVPNKSDSSLFVFHFGYTSCVQHYNFLCLNAFYERKEMGRVHLRRLGSNKGPIPLLILASIDFCRFHSLTTQLQMNYHHKQSALYHRNVTLGHREEYY